MPIDAPTLDPARVEALLADLETLRGGDRPDRWREHERGILQELDADPDASAGVRDPRHPVLLLPVRLETRFADTQLLVRIYPDAVHVDTHEPELTHAERAAAERYWRQRWEAATDAERIDAADQQLAAAVGAHRSGHVAEATRPLNQDRRPNQPVPAGTPLDPPPELPATPRREGAWTRAPHSQALPDRWLVRARSGTRTFEGFTAAVPSPLVVGPDPSGDGTYVDVADDDGWLTEFGAALEVGMAIILPLDEDVVAQGLDEVLVVGIRAADDHVAGARRTSELLTAHRYTDGLALHPGGASVEDPMPPRQPTVGEHPATPRQGSDGERLVRALGLDPSVAAGVDGAGASEETTAWAAITALWRPGWHAMLDHHLVNVFADDEPEQRQRDLDRVRVHAAAHLRPEGHLPLLRIGTLPYGLLPVTDSAALTPGDPALASVKDTALRVLAGTRTSQGRSAVTRLDPDDPLTLLTVLAHLPAPVRFRGRPMHGRTQALAALAALSTQDADLGWMELVDAEKRVATALARLGILDPDGRPRLARSRFAPVAYAICAPFIQPGPLSGSEPVQDDTLHALSDASAAELLATWDRRREVEEDTPPTLLRRLLEAAVRHELANLAWWWLPVEDRSETPRFEPEVVPTVADPRTGLAPHGAARTLVDAWLADHPGAGLLRPPEPDTADRVAAGRSAKELAEALRVLATAPSAEVERYVASAVDATAGRVDAWLGSFANARLEELRQQTPQGGLYLGGWGYVRDVRPDFGRIGAFVHAPSPALATTAAALAQGRRDHATTVPNPLELDLHASAVRSGRNLLRTVRSGTPLSEAVGHALERALRAADRHNEVAVLRQLAPGQGADTPSEQAQRECCDGLSILRRFRGVEDPPLPFGQAVDTPSGPLPMPDPTGPEGQALGDALQAGQARLDAAAGVLLAEAVHQGVHGDIERAAATLAAAGRGGTPPTPLEVARADRSAAELTVRVAVAGRADTVDQPATLAQAAPGLAAVAEQLLGPAREVAFRARSLGGEDGRSGPWRTHTLQDLGLDPLTLALAADEPAPAPGRLRVGADDGSGDGAVGGRLARSLAAGHLAALAEGPGPIELDLTAATGQVSAAAVWSVAVQVRSLFTAGRPLRPQDLTPAMAVGPADDPDEGPSAADEAWRERVGEVAGALRARLGLAGEDDVPGPLTALDDAVHVAVLADLQALAALGLPVAPGTHHLAGGDLSGWVAVALRAARRAETEPAWPDPVRTWLAARPLPADPGLVPRPATSVPGADDGRLTAWLGDQRHVRPPLTPLVAATAISGAVLEVDEPEMLLAQEPEGPWLADPAGGAPGTVVTLAVADGESSDSDGGASTGSLSGLLLDEWHEAIPESEAATTLALEAPRPGAAAPQSALLAVPPDDQPWTHHRLAAVAEEAVALAQARVLPPTEVAPGTITPDLGHLLPALLLLDADIDLRELACPPERPSRPKHDEDEEPA